jgi:hypothetical protein
MSALEFLFNGSGAQVAVTSAALLVQSGSGSLGSIPTTQTGSSTERNVVHIRTSTTSSVPSPTDRFASILEIGAMAPDESVREQAKRLFGQLSSWISKKLGGANLPSTACSVGPNDELLVEWIFSDRRIGFSLERDPNSSSWFYFVVRSGVTTTAHGLLRGLPTLKLERVLDAALSGREIA